MTLFAPLAGPRVFGLPPGADFARALVDGIEARLAGQGPETLARVELWVNTQRARRALTAAFARGPARLLPRIRVVTELAADPLAPVDLPPAASALGRKLELARLVGALLRAQPGLASETAAFDLADSLGDLLDEMQGEGIEPRALARLDAGGHAEHWRRSLEFLTILQDYVAGSAPIEGQGRMRAIVEAWTQAWDADPPAHPVIVAGSTGSRGATRAFMAAVARLPQGALVLPGFDADLTPAVWDRIAATEVGAADHPQHGFRRLADALGFSLRDVRPWDDAAPPAPARNRVISLALRPAPVTDQWRTEGAALAPTLPEAFAGVTWIEAEGARAEARAVALVLRRAAEEGVRAALITPDRSLARRVTAELSRWSLRPDDSAGRPLALTPPGVLLRRLAALMGRPATPEALLSLLKHPLTASGPARRTHLALTAKLELEVLRRGGPLVGWRRVRAWAEAQGGEAPGWAAWLAGVFAPLEDRRDATLAQRVARHRAAAEALASGPGTGPHELWEKEAGLQARRLMESLAQEADGLGPTSASDYRALLASLLAGRDVPEEAVVTHSGIAIWGALEARVQSADLLVLGGLNEGIWPRLPGADPWLSRLLRRDLGLASPERIVGLAAHDFQQAMGAARVFLSRATRDAEAPTVPSRWLLRLENLLTGLGPAGADALRDARGRGMALLAQAASLDRPAETTPPARRPCPRPPAEARPTSLSVTQIETLVRDPYAVYACKVLCLAPLDPLGRAPDMMARGSAIHAALEAFLKATEEALPPDAREVFARETALALAQAAPWPAVRACWTARLEQAAEWFLAGEAERRARATPFAREASGRRELDGLPRPFAVTAKADRIDRCADGRYAIYDYKSGGVPSAKEAEVFHLQLPLEAAIAQAGGFADLPPGEVAHLELIGLARRQTRPIPADGAAVTRTWDRLRRLIAAYQDPATGYAARLRPQKLGHAGDYDHLSRKGEWADGDPLEPEDVA